MTLRLEITRVPTTPPTTLTRFSVFLLGVLIVLIWPGSSLTAGNGCSAPQFSPNLGLFDVGIGPRSAAAADFNKDGKSDLAVANYGSGLGSPDGGISILLGDGMGGFSSPQNISAGINPRSIVTADFNNDGNADIVVLKYVSGSCCISGFAHVLLGNGSGGFSFLGTDVSIGPDPKSLAVGDFNKDGKLDLAASVAAGPSGSVAILLGNGAGGFGPGTTFNAQGNGISIATGDFNGDGNLDLVSANQNSFNISVLLGDGAGAFGSPTTFSATDNPNFVAVGDLNQDSKLDVVTSTSFFRVSVFFGVGNGTFGSAIFFTVASSAQSVVIRDVNADSRPDLATANSIGNTVSVLLNQGSNTFGPAINYNVGPGPYFILSNDFNGDGSQDLAVTNLAANRVSVLSGDGAGGFGHSRSFNAGSVPSAIVGGDLNGDGKTDLVVANSAQMSVSVLLGDGTGSFGTDSKYSTHFNPKALAMEDFNRDGKLDVAVADNTCCQISQSVDILLGNGMGGFFPFASFNAGTGAYAIVAADFNNDTKADLGVVNNADNNVSILIGDGNGGFAAPANTSLPGSPTDLAAADFNGDGITDLAVAVNNLVVLFGNGNGSFTQSPLILLPGPTSIAVGDLNGDGRPDIATANSTGSLSVLLGDGLGGFASPTTLTIPSPFSVIIGDLNGDGKADLAATGTNDIFIALGDGTGTFGPIVPNSVGGNPREVLISDLNGDGRPDLASANGAGNVSVLLDTCAAPPVMVPSLSIGDVTLAEGNNGQTNATFTVALSSTSDKAVAVSFYTSSQSATSGVDYQSVFGRIMFPPGSTSGTITVLLNGDTTNELDETFLVNLSNPVNTTIARTQGIGKIVNDDTPTLQLSASSYSVNEASLFGSITVTRGGDTSGAATVKFSTSDATDVNFQCNPASGSTPTGAASRKCDYHILSGRLRFAAGESSRQIILSVVNDVYVEPSESLTITLSNPTGATLGSQSSATINITDNDTPGQPNPIDGTAFYVRMLYVDLLSREPDPAGNAGWIHRIDFCGQPGEPPPPCDRVTVGGDGFLRSAEFFEREFFVLRLYRAGLGRILIYPEVGDLAYVSGFLTAADLELNKQELVAEIMSRAEFSGIYNSLGNAAYVDKLIQTAAVTIPTSVRDGWVNALNGSTKTRAQVYRELSERQEVSDRYLHEAQVVSCYYGFFTRNPDGAYFNYLDRLDRGEINLGDLANAFINAAEYKQRFGP